MAQRIVVAEDEEHIAKLISFKLERNGYETIWAKDGGEALEKIRSVLPDLILLDIMMPVMDGYEVLKKIKEDERTSSIPVIILTARGQEQDIVRGFDLGIEDYILKPFRPSELVARIKKTLK